MRILLILVEAASVVVLVALWRRKAELWRKFAWTPVVALPLLGPALYFGMFEVPAKQAETDRAQENRDAFAGYKTDL